MNATKRFAILPTSGAGINGVGVRIVGIEIVGVGIEKVVLNTEEKVEVGA